MVNLKLFGKAIVLKIALQAGTQAAEAKNAGSLIYFLFERREQSHFPHSEMRDFLQINDDSNAFLGEPPMEKILYP